MTEPATALDGVDVGAVEREVPAVARPDLEHAAHAAGDELAPVGALLA
jgi:hypothetical protein